MRSLREIVEKYLFSSSHSCSKNRADEQGIQTKEERDGRHTSNSEQGSNRSIETPRRSQSGDIAGRLRQYYASFTVSLAVFAAGLGSGWASPMLVLLKSDDSPVGKMTLEEMSYLETLPLLVGLIGIFFYGIIIDKFGRKVTGYLFTLFSISGWIFLIVATQPYHLYIGRGLTGMSNVGGAMVGEIYVSEAVHESRRGALMSYVVFAGNVGALLGYVLGDLLSYRWFNASCIVAPIIFPFLFVPLPESPYFLHSKSRLEEARKSLMWFRSGREDIADQELMSMNNFQRPNTSCMDLFRSKGTRKAILILVFMFSFQQIGGGQIVQGYASVIFEDAGNAIPPNKCAIILITIKVVSSYASILLVDRFGRRLLMMSMFVVMSICMIAVSLYLYEKEYGNVELDHLSWLPLISLSSFNVASSVGIGTLAQIIGNEVVPTEIKGAAGMVSGTVTMSMMMLSLQAFPYVRGHFGAYANFTYPAAFNLLGCLITYFIIPETKGKSLEEIMTLLGR